MKELTGAKIVKFETAGDYILGQFVEFKTVTPKEGEPFQSWVMSGPGGDFCFGEKAALTRHRGELVLGRFYLVLFLGMKVHPEKKGQTYGEYKVFELEGQEIPLSEDLKKIKAKRDINQ